MKKNNKKNNIHEEPAQPVENSAIPAGDPEVSNSKNEKSESQKQQEVSEKSEKSKSKSNAASISNKKFPENSQKSESKESIPSSPSSPHEEISLKDKAEEESSSSFSDEKLLGVDLGTGAMENDDNCPLRFSISKHRLTTFEFHVQKQKNQLLFINKNVKEMKELLDELHNENQTLASIVEEFRAEAENNNDAFTDTVEGKKLNVYSPETDEYCQKVESAFNEFVKVHTQLADDASNVSQLYEKLRLLRKMNDSLKEQLKKNPEEEADEIIDILEDDIEMMENENGQIKQQYIDEIQERQDQIDELYYSLNQKPPIKPKEIVINEEELVERSLRKGSPRKNRSPRKGSPRKTPNSAKRQKRAKKPA